jgi:hypothetical protein
MNRMDSIGLQEPVSTHCFVVDRREKIAILAFKLYDAAPEQGWLCSGATLASPFNILDGTEVGDVCNSQDDASHATTPSMSLQRPRSQ